MAVKKPAAPRTRRTVFIEDRLWERLRKQALRLSRMKGETIDRSKVLRQILDSNLPE